MHNRECCAKNTVRGVRLSGKYTTRHSQVLGAVFTYSTSMWCLLFCVGWCRLKSVVLMLALICSYVVASLFVVKSAKKGKKLPPKDPGPLDLNKISLEESFANHIKRVVKPYILASLRAPVSALNRIVQPKGY